MMVSFDIFGVPSTNVSQILGKVILFLVIIGSIQMPFREVSRILGLATVILFVLALYSNLYRRRAWNRLFLVL